MLFTVLWLLSGFIGSLIMIYEVFWKDFDGDITIIDIFFCTLMVCTYSLLGPIILIGLIVGFLLLKYGNVVVKRKDK